MPQILYHLCREVESSEAPDLSDTIAPLKNTSVMAVPPGGYKGWMGPLPTGTLTLLFSDIEGSTSLLNGLGPRWGDALSAQRRILRGAFQAHDGHEMGT